MTTSELAAQPNDPPAASRPAAIRIHPDDTVAVALPALAAGETIEVDARRYTLGTDVPAGHKLALVALRAREPVVKYGFPIGVTTEAIAVGALVLAPRPLAFGFAAYLMLLCGGGSKPPLAADQEGQRVRELWRTEEPGASDETLRQLVLRVCTDEALWQADLSRVPGFAEQVADALVRMTRVGVRAALDAQLGGVLGTTRPIASSLSDGS